MNKQHKIDMEDTIAAISTPIGESAIGIVRLSGNRCLEIAGRIFRSKTGKAPSTFKSFTIHYGRVMDGDLDVDEALLAVMRAPKSYTKEDMAEISCHGGVVPLRKVLSGALRAGARLAEPGEFTRRAFINGRIDLAQAEAVLDIIRSKTDSSMAMALERLDGGLSAAVKGIKDEVISILAGVEASVDFPEEDLEIISEACTKERLGSVLFSLKKLADSANKGIIMREGVSCVICGKPNVGKSSLLNALLKKERAIVTHVPGTTRDSIEEYADIEGIPFRLIDTAGITSSADIVEKQGIIRSREHIKNASLVMLVLDAGVPLSGEDTALLKDTEGRPRIIVINKSDLPRKIDFKAPGTVEVSAKKGYAIDKLRTAMAEAVFGGAVIGQEGCAISNLRQKEACRQAAEAASRALGAVEGGQSAELAAVDIRECLDHISEIAGETFDEDILDRVFSSFCIGK